MSDSYISVTSVTYAIKGRDLLLQRGILASIGRTPGHVDRVGCGYSIFVRGNLEAAVSVLRQHGIKVVSVGGEAQ